MRALLFVAALLGSSSASAFCGFYVAGGGAELFNNATQVVLMRNGTRTVLSMQNNYQGPPSDFAMVVPVPIVLQKENVKTLSKSIFEKVEKLAAPRLVEYWEQDPCPRPRPPSSHPSKMAPRSAALEVADSFGAGPPRDLGVTVEAKFEVGEYEIVILSAKDALGLDTWLKLSKYKIPDNAAPLLRPYVQQGMKFFVAKVDSTKVKFENGQATLSPLRFHYDTEQFALPVRLGLINAKDKQDLIVHVLARNQRYEVANTPNVTVPTNLDLSPSAKTEFAPFYVSLFDRTQKKTPGAVVTEYAWSAGNCDPCPTPPLTDLDLNVLGLDVLDGDAAVEPEIEVKNLEKLPLDEQQFIKAMIENTKLQVKQRRRGRGGGPWNFVLTRLHARYDKSTLAEDLVFKAANPIAGGREFLTNGQALEQGAVPFSSNMFQARYAIRYPWKGPITCANPQRGRWGGPPNGGQPGPTPATGVAFAPRGKDLGAYAESPIAELEIGGKKERAGVPLGVKGK